MNGKDGMGMTGRLAEGYRLIGRAKLCGVAVLLVLGGCGQEEGPPGSSRKEEAPAAKTVIVERQDGANESHAAGPPPAPASPANTVAPLPRPAPPSSETRYRAVGTEPFWAVTVKGSELTLERPDRPSVRVPITRTDDGRAIRYLGDGLAMVVTEGPCSDGMSDAVWAERVSVSFGEGTLKGCGGVREDF